MLVRLAAYSSKGTCCLGFTSARGQRNHISGVRGSCSQTYHMMTTVLCTTMSTAHFQFTFSVRPHNRLKLHPKQKLRKIWQHPWISQPVLHTLISPSDETHPHVATLILKRIQRLSASIPSANKDPSDCFKGRKFHQVPNSTCWMHGSLLTASKFTVIIELLSLGQREREGST